MKPFLLLLILTASINYLPAQIQKGSVLLGGTAGINNLSEDGSSVTSINVSPEAGFFLSDRFALGGQFEAVATFSDGETTGSLGLNAFSRYYFTNQGMSRFFAHVDLGAQEPSLGDDESDISAAFGLSVGADFFLNENVAIEGLLGYHRYQNFKYDTGLNLVGLNFGVVAFIEGKR